MSRAQQWGAQDMRRMQRFDKTDNGKAIGPHRGSGVPKSKRVSDSRIPPLPKTNLLASDAQTRLKAADTSSWDWARSNAATPSSSCSSQVRTSGVARSTTCPHSRAIEGDCGQCHRAPLSIERIREDLERDRVLSGRSFISRESSFREVASSDGTVKSRFYCAEPGCLKSCARESDMARHRRSKHGGTTFECSFPGCQFRNPRKDRLIKHAREKHPLKLIECPAIAYVSSTNGEANGARRSKSRDQVNPEAGRESSARVQNFDQSRSGFGRLIVSGFKLLDGETTAPDEHRPSQGIDEQRNSAAHSRSRRNASNNGRASKMRSRSLPKSVVLEPSPCTIQQSKIREAIGRLECAAVNHYANHSTRPVSTPPSVSKPSKSSKDRQTDFDIRKHRFPPDTVGLASAPSLTLDIPAQDGDNGRPSATSQLNGASWADVVRNTSSTKTSVGPSINDGARDNDGLAGRSKGKRRKLNGDGYEEFFVCIGHHRGRPGRDATNECEGTLKDYFSQLERHHERHDWFYCARCCEEFPNADARKAHRDGQRCRIRCVKEDCPSYRTFPQTKCPHFIKDSDAGELVWMELFRIFRPGEAVPSPKVRRAATSRQLSQSAASSRRDAVSSPPTSSHRGATSPRSAPQSAQATPARGAIGTFSPIGDRSRALHTLADSLWRHIHSHRTAISLLTSQLYDVAMRPDRTRNESEETDHTAPVLEIFVSHLWSWAHGEIKRTNDTYADLLTFATDWLSPATIERSLQTGTPELIDDAIHANSGSLEGVGFQFPATSQQQSAQASQSANPLQQYLMTTPRAGSLQNSQNPDPWNHVFGGSNQASTQTQCQTTHVNTMSSGTGTQTQVAIANVAHSYGTLESSLSSFSSAIRPDMSTRHQSYSTNATSMNLPDVHRPRTSNTLPESSFHGSNMGQYDIFPCVDGQSEMFDLESLD